eukprot:4393022-Amphidinium_carterae.2
MHSYPNSQSLGRQFPENPNGAQNANSLAMRSLLTGRKPSYAWSDNRNTALEVVKENGYKLEFASEELQNDREVVLAAVSQCGKALCYAAEELMRDREVVLTAVSQNGDALRHAPD